MDPDQILNELKVYSNMLYNKQITVQMFDSLGITAVQWARELEKIAIKRYYNAISSGNDIDDYSEESQRMQRKCNQISTLVRQLEAVLT